jgi:hypothetical protein
VPPASQQSLALGQDTLWIPPTTGAYKCCTLQLCAGGTATGEAEDAVKPTDTRNTTSVSPAAIFANPPRLGASRTVCFAMAFFLVVANRCRTRTLLPGHLTWLRPLSGESSVGHGTGSAAIISCSAARKERIVSAAAARPWP